MKIKKSYIILGVVALLLIVVVSTCVSTRNGIISKDQTVQEKWANVETQYQRRLDLIPNLVNAVKGYAAHESATLESVTNARVGLKKAYDEAEDSKGASVAQQSAAQSQLYEQARVYINAVHEAYPDLKANTNFLDLQAQLEGTENRIATARTDYNKAVREYNTKILKFPGSLFAWGYEEKESFKADEKASKAHTVDFGTGAETPAVDF